MVKMSSRIETRPKPSRVQVLNAAQTHSLDIAYDKCIICRTPNLESVPMTCPSLACQTSVEAYDCDHASCSAAFLRAESGILKGSDALPICIWHCKRKFFRYHCSECDLSSRSKVAFPVSQTPTCLSSLLTFTCRLVCFLRRSHARRVSQVFKSVFRLRRRSRVLATSATLVPVSIHPDSINKAAAF